VQQLRIIVAIMQSWIENKCLNLCRKIAIIRVGGHQLRGSEGALRGFKPERPTRRVVMFATDLHHRRSPHISESFQIFRGTYLAHAKVYFVESVQLFLILANPHNLKVIGSNPIPATKTAAGRSASSKAALRGGFHVSAVCCNEACHRRWHRYIEFLR
jgi:hypothetical protein